MVSSGRTMTAGDWAMLLVLAAVWGGSFFFNELALPGFPPFTLVFVRVALASLVLWAVLRATGGRLPREPRIWVSLLVMAVLNSVIPWTLFVAAQAAITGGLAAILNAVTPIFGVIVAHFLTSDEKVTPGRLAGVVLGFVGVAAMIGPDVFSGIGANILPELGCLVGALSYSFASIYGRRFARIGLSPLATATGQIMMAALALLPLALVFEAPWNMAMPGAQAWFAVAMLALVSTAFAFVLFFRLLASAGATNSMLVTFLIPVSAILLGALLLGERLEPQHWFGMVLIALGLVAIDGRLPRRLFLRSPAPSL